MRRPQAARDVVRDRRVPAQAPAPRPPCVGYHGDMDLFRPVGLEELRLIYQAEMRAFPPRLPDQPIFYPVTNEGYAIQIARDWNTKSGTKAGFVTRFSIADDYASKFERRVVGAKEHEELWVPADELGALNAHIEGRIEVTRAFFGDEYRGHVPDARGKDAREQLVALAETPPHSGFDVISEMTADDVAVFLNFFFWQQADFSSDGIDRSARDELLGKLRAVWNKDAHGGVDLGTTTSTAPSSG